MSWSRIVLSSCALVAACAGAVRVGHQHPEAERDVSTTRAVFFLYGDAVEPVACFDGSTGRYGDCAALLHEGDVVRLGTRTAPLGAAFVEPDDVCSDVVGYHVPTGSFPDDTEHSFATSPPESDFDIRVVPFREEEFEVPEALWGTLATLASEYFARPADTWHEPCPGGSERVDADEVRIGQRFEADVDVDGTVDQLYVVGASPIDTETCDQTWSALVLVTGGALSETTVLTETDDAMIRMLGTLELDGAPPRELIYQFGYEGLHTTIGRIVRGSLEGLGADGCDP